MTLTPAEHAALSPATVAPPAASEALRALVKPILEAPGRTESYEAAEPLIRALPFIADCIEAAERAVSNAQLVCDEEIELDRALVALRDSLGAKE